MSNQEIKSRIIKTTLVKWRELEFLQPDNFKEWNERGDIKLTNSLLKYQFVDPFKVWEHNGKLYCLDGRHRFLDLEAILNGPEFQKVPELLPATFIDCSNMQEAAELVLVYSSAYARITEKGLEDFTANFNLDLPELQNLISLPDFESNEEMAVQYPVDFVAELKDAPPTLKLTFDNLKQLDHFEIELKKLIQEERFSNIKYSISAGEL